MEQTVVLRIDLIRDTIKELGIHWSAIVEPGMYSLKVVRGTEEKLKKYWPEVTTAGKHEGDDKYIMFIDFEDVHYYVKWHSAGGFVEVDYPEEATLEKAEEPVQEKNDIAKAFDTLKTAMATDPGYLWSWVCNTACPIMDSGIEHGQANKAAARVLAHLFQVDVTEMAEYKDILARTSKEVVLPDTSADDPGVNTIHVTVTGFDSNSGAEALARHLDHILGGSGRYETKLNIADTTLSDAQRNLALPSLLHSVIHITGVESRYHTDRVSALTDPEIPDTDLNGGEVDPDEWGIDLGDDCDAACSYNDDEPTGKMTINLKVDNSDLSPLTTIGYFRSAYPKADLNVDVTPDLILTDAIAKLAKVPEEKKVIHIDIDKDDPDPSTTIAIIQEAYNDNGQDSTGMVTIEEKPTLANPENRKNAYVFVKDTGEGNMVAVLHADTKVEGFDPESFVGEGFYPLQMPDYTALENLLSAHLPTAVEYALELFENNKRWLNEFGDGTVPLKRRIDGPFSLWNISQGSIPKAIYNEIEDCWCAFQNIDRLEELAKQLDDPTIVIGVEDYLKVTRGGLMVVREHPRLEELFLKYIKYKAQSDTAIARWIDSFEF
jgi:hypothetical protein